MNENELKETATELETALPAENARIYRAEEPETAIGARRNTDSPIVVRALIFGCLAALAVFTADISRDNDIPENADSDTLLSEEAAPADSGDTNPADDTAEGNGRGETVLPPKIIPKNMIAALSDKTGQAVHILSLAAAKTELWSFTDMMRPARERFSELFESLEITENNNNENNFPYGGNTNNVTGSRLTLSGDDSGILSKGARRMPSSADEEGEVSDSPMQAVSGNDSLLPYTSCGDEAGGDILRQTYPAYTGENYIDLPEAGQLRNVTSLSADDILRECSVASDFVIEMNSDLPQVLIMHTHTTESYEKSERLRYDSDFPSRTTDSEMNMTAVGRAMAKVLSDSGINTLHDETIHDYPSYNGSYDRSRETVTKILRDNPSIKVVLDVHRDAIERADGTRVAPYVRINGRNAAQIMIICGCDDGTMGMPDCMKNLRTASLFEQYIESSSPGLTRPVLYDYRKYNQDLTTGSLLIEVGSNANSIDEAVYAGELAAQGIAEALKSTAVQRTR